MTACADLMCLKRKKNRSITFTKHNFHEHSFRESFIVATRGINVNIFTQKEETDVPVSPFWVHNQSKMVNIFIFNDCEKNYVAHV